MLLINKQIRAGQPHDERKDMKDEEMRKRVWTGVVPTYIKYGEPQAGPDNLAGAVPEYVKSFVKNANEDGENKANESMIEPSK